MKMSRSDKYIITFSLFFCYFAYGVNFYVVGPTLIELAGLFQTSIEQICLIYTVRSAGYTCGSLSGFLFKYINRQLIFVFFMALMGVTLALMPHVTGLTWLFVLAGINGFSIGSFDTAINVWVLEIWAEESGPFMQALHFTYGIGSFVAPLICEPFLSTESIHGGGGHGPPATSPSVSTTPGSLISSTKDSIINDSRKLLLNLNDTKIHDLFSHIDSVDPIDYLIYIPYAIAGAITVFSALVVLGLYYHKKYEPPTKVRRSQEIKTDKSDVAMLENGLEPPFPCKRSFTDRMPPFITIWLVGMGSLFLTFFVGMEQMHLQFLPTFAVNTELDLSPSTAAMMSSAAALAFTVGRCVSIPLAIKLKPQTILYTNHFLMLLGTILLAIYANNSETMLWVGNIILGCGFSSVYASIYAFLEQKIRVTNRIGSLFVFAGGLTAAVSPSLVGQYIEANPLILVWFNLACCLLCLTIFVIIHLTVYLQAAKSVAKSFDDGIVVADEELKERQLQLIGSTEIGGIVVTSITDLSESDTEDKYVAPA
ncbi:hypothetical protein DERP_008231 [Dermatophagoides pteronyssinus]|uniref:Sodium-dependent glucose transporter 1-like n=1 Tax=Dermatophagoides pteronyssinus TaxID=6956 RepID=A0ABQ8J621_DERPT|nr:hypothetical protein DERP_008231 [Dermatophagoides pteronyssinus]